MLAAYLALKPLSYIFFFLFLVWAIKHIKLAYAEHQVKKAAYQNSLPPNDDSWYYDLREAYFSYFTEEAQTEDWEDVRKQLR